MTIRIEQEALFRLLSKPPLTPPLHVDPTITCKEQLGDVCIRKEERGNLREATSRDDDSVFTASTASLSSDDTDDEDDFTRAVYFAEPLVTEEWTREYTPKQNIADLYYSAEDTTR